MIMGVDGLGRVWEKFIKDEDFKELRGYDGGWII